MARAWARNEEEKMGMFDDAMKNAVPGGNLAAPIAVAVGALVLGKLFSGGGAAPAAHHPAPAPPPVAGRPVGGATPLPREIPNTRPRPAGQYPVRPGGRRPRHPPPG